MKKVTNIPSGWKVSALDEITVRGSGHTPSQKHPEYWNGGIPWVSLADLSRLDKPLISETEKEISSEGLRRSSAVLHPPGTVLMSRDAGVGKSSIMGKEMAVSQHFITWNCSDHNVLHNLYLYYWLQAKKRYFERQAVGSTIKTIGLPLFRKLVISYPCLSEQKAIADLLSTWDEAIEKTERLIQAKERRFQWLLQEIMSDSAKGNVNKGWRKVAIGSFLTESRIPDTINDPNKRLTVRLHLKGVEAREVRGTESSDATAYFIRKSGQLVYGKQNIFRGAVGIIPPELDGYTSTQDIPAFDIDNTVDPDWLLFLFSYPGFYKKLEIYASGSGSKRLHPKDLFKIHVSVPPLEEQKRLADGLSIAQMEIDLLKELAVRYKSQKRGLMQKLLTGQWRVTMDKEVA